MFHSNVITVLFLEDCVQLTGFVVPGFNSKRAKRIRRDRAYDDLDSFVRSISKEEQDKIEDCAVKEKEEPMDEEHDKIEDCAVKVKKEIVYDDYEDEDEEHEDSGTEEENLNLVVSAEYTEHTRNAMELLSEKEPNMFVILVGELNVNIEEFKQSILSYFA